jgi:uncharacterized damage-inducible protein DinB
MHPRLLDVLEYTDRARDELLSLLAGLSQADWESREGDGWTVREVVAHLHLVEDSSVRALFRAFRTARDQGLGHDAGGPSLLHSLDAARIEAGERPLQAPPMVTPNDLAEPSALLERLAHARAGLHKWSTEADGYALADVTFPHPALGTLSLYQWVLFIGQHERRHVHQIRRILAAAPSALSNPAGTTGTAAASYVAALLDVLGDRAPLEVWAEHADAIDALTRDVSPADAVRPEREGKWSIAQLVSHLVDTEIVYGYRVRMIVAQDSPDIQGYDQDAWARRLRYEDEDLAVLRTELRVLRERNLRLVKRLTADELERCGQHAERGLESVAHIVRLLAAHDLVHRRQLSRIRKAIGLPA